MKPIKAQMTYYGLTEVDEEEEVMEASFKNVYFDADKISSFFILEPEVIKGESVKCFGITCDGEFYSVKPEPHVYQILFDKFIKNAIKE